MHEDNNRMLVHLSRARSINDRFFPLFPMFSRTVVDRPNCSRNGPKRSFLVLRCLMLPTAEIIRYNTFTNRLMHVPYRSYCKLRAFAFVRHTHTHTRKHTLSRAFEIDEHRRRNVLNCLSASKGRCVIRKTRQGIVIVITRKNIVEHDLSTIYQSRIHSSPFNVI